MAVQVWQQWPSTLDGGGSGEGETTRLCLTFALTHTHTHTPVYYLSAGLLVLTVFRDLDSTGLTIGAQKQNYVHIYSFSGIKRKSCKHNIALVVITDRFTRKLC